MCALPSRAEPFGIFLLEAAACRRPIVASRVGGVSEIIQNEVSGLLVPPDDADALSAALLRLLDCAKLRMALADSAYETVSTRFRWEMMGEQYESLMSRLVTPKPCGPHNSRTRTRWHMEARYTAQATDELRRLEEAAWRIQLTPIRNN